MSDKGLEITRYRVIIINPEISGNNVFRPGNWKVENPIGNSEINRIVRFNELGNEELVAILLVEGVTQL